MLTNPTREGAPSIGPVPNDQMTNDVLMDYKTKL